MMTAKETLINKLKSHDWYYEHSEDHNAYLKGVAERADIYDLVCSMSGPDIEPLLLEHVPKDCQEMFCKMLFAFNRHMNFIKERL